MLIDADAIPPVRKTLHASDFYVDKHKQLYEAMCAVNDRREPIDLITVQAELAKHKWLDEVGGMGYLTSLINTVPTTANVAAYAAIVAEKANMRRVQVAARKVVDKSYGDVSGDDLNAYAMSEMQKAIFHRGSSDLRDVGTDLLEFIESSRNEKQEGKEPSSLVQVPFKYQHFVMPLAKGETTAIGAGSNIGKTTYMFNLLLGVARLDGPAIGFSLEMSRRQILQKFWGRVAGINTLHIRHHALTDEQWDRSSLKAAGLLGLPLKYMVRPRMTWSDIAMEATAFKAKHGTLSLVMVDYWQILNDLPRKDERRDTLLGRLVEDGKALAMELDCHVAFLVQTRINPEQPVPTLADVLESRDIVRFADNSLFLTRPTEFIGSMRDKTGSRLSPKIQLPKANGEWVEVACDAQYPRIEIRGEQYRGKSMFENVMIGVQGKQRMGPKDVVPYWIDLPTGKMADLAKPWPWDNPHGGLPHQEIPD